MDRYEAVLNRRHVHQIQTADERRDRMEAALGKGLQRLAEVKAKWDPENVFRTNRNIKPV